MKRPRWNARMAAERWAQENAPRDERCSFCGQIPISFDTGGPLVGR